MNGFFSPEALAALQEAYANQLTPEEQDYDLTTGLPTNVVSNTAPWHGSIELWKYPSGKGPEEAQQIFFTGGDDEESEDVGSYDESEDGDPLDALGDMDDDEINSLIDELLSSSAEYEEEEDDEEG